MEYIGAYGEYRVLASLLERGVEAYSAIKANQKDYDITAVLKKPSLVVRIQVKATELDNKSTNNPISGVDKDYDYLVIVVVNKEGRSNFYILTHKEARDLAREDKTVIYTTKSENRKFSVRPEVAQYEDRWDKITNGT